MDILPEAYAVVREASHRVANHRHFDVQLMAGYFLFNNKTVELFTGEGKTLAANLPLYLYALTGKGAHLVTVNDYLARRDAEWNGHILNSLGITVAAVNNETQFRFITDEEAKKLKGDDAKKLIKERTEKGKVAGNRMKYDHMSGVNLIECSKKEAYACDVVYGTNNEFGFDYLRDNMARDIEERVQGPLHYAIVDEADSILIDEARTPLIISQSADQSNDMYQQFAKIVDGLQPEVDYTVDEKQHAAVATEEGLNKVDKALGVKNVYENALYAYHLDNALKAKALYNRDDEYIVRDGEVLIVDEFTGRVLAGRRYSEGLHQAIEAKEGVEVKRESRTLATITLQNYFRLYDFMSGMTGTALTEAEEFANIYKLDTIVVPTNRPVVRKDQADTVYRTAMGKYRAIVNDIIEHHEKGQPVLVGTTSVEKSEIISEMLSKEGVEHNVLNAKFHEKESHIVSQAGQKDLVTIATNMAGRGTDIALGEGVKELGGLYIIGSERHDSRRIDNQLRGRSGRQGDPGESRFYVSFEDDLMRIFGGVNMGNFMGKVGMNDDMPIASSILGRTIESAQKKVEAYNYDIRKNLVEYDDVLNQQREIIYGMRRRIMSLIKVQQKALAEQASVKKFGAQKPKENLADAQKLDPEKLRTIELHDLIEDVEAFSIKHEESYSISALEEFPQVNKPLNVFILKKVLDYVRFLLTAQLSDDMEIDNEETRKAVSQLQAFLSEDLTEVAAKLLGYPSALEFFKEFDAQKSASAKQDLLMKLVVAGFIFHVTAVGPEAMLELGRMLVLQSIDNYWMEHLDTMGDLREGISLRNLAQRDPLVEYKNEGFRMFDEMLGSVDNAIVSRFFKVRVLEEERQAPLQEVHQDAGSLLSSAKVKNAGIAGGRMDPAAFGNSAKNEGFVEGELVDEPKRVGSRGRDSRPGNVSRQSTVKNVKKVGRNDPCPCGSGKKYKKCHYPQYGE